MPEKRREETEAARDVALSARNKEIEVAVEAALSNLPFTYACLKGNAPDAVLFCLASVRMGVRALVRYAMLTGQDPEQTCSFLLAAARTVFLEEAQVVTKQGLEGDDK